MNSDQISEKEPFSYYWLINELFPDRQFATLSHTAKILNKYCEIQYPEDLMIRVLKATCVQDQEENFLRFDWFKDILLARFGNVVEKFTTNISCLCNSDGTRASWYMPDCSYWEAQQLVEEKKHEFILRHSSNDKNIFVIVYRRGEKVFQSRIFYGNKYYFVDDKKKYLTVWAAMASEFKVAR